MWAVKLSKEAEKQFKKLPLDRQALILKRLQEMRVDPFQGDVRPIKSGRWRGRYRKVAGR